MKKEIKMTKLMTVFLALIIALPWAAAATKSDGYYGKMKVAPKAEVKAYPFDLGRVKLLSSPFERAMKINQKYLLELDVDRMLWPYHERAGLPTKGKRYGGWEQEDCVGHVSGHYLSALSIMYAATGDPEMKKRVDYMVSELAKVQAKHGDGYAGSMRPEVWKETFSGTFKVDLFALNGGYVPWYVVHKTFAGLQDAYVYAGNKQALDVAVKFGAWAKKGLDNLDEKEFQIMMRCVPGGMNESLANLYALTGNKDFLALARRFDHKVIIDPLAKKQDKMQGRHVNTQVPKIIGSARLYELSGNKRDATIARYFWDLAVNTRSFAPGGVDIHERFGAPESEAANLAWNSSETCSVYNMLKLSRHLFGWKPDAKYMDYYERALYNQILGSQDPDSGGMTYFYCLKPGHFKIYSTPFDSMWCCVGTGTENHSKYGDTIYWHNDNTLWVNLFIPSTLDWREKKVRVRMETKFPADDTIKLTVNTKKSQKLDLKIRVPYWATKGAEVTINGKKQSVKSTPKSYLTLSRQWKDGDKIAVRLPMSLHLRPARDKKDMVTIMYGPVVLAGELGTKGMPHDFSSNHKAHSGDQDPPVPVLLVDPSKDPSSWLERVPGETLRFKTVGVGKPNDVTLIPISDLHHQRYTVYWQTMAAGDWKPAASLKPEKISKSKLTLGLDYKYFEGEWKMLPDFSKLEVKKTGTIENFDLSIKDRNDHFGIVFSGYLKVAEKGEYIFASKSDDGSRLTLAGEELVLNDGLHAMVSVPSKPVLLSPGFYPIEVQFFEGTYGEGIEISSYSPVDGKWNRIPKSMLYRRK